MWGHRSLKPSRAWVALLASVLAVPTVYFIFYPAKAALDWPGLRPYLAAGALLGLCQVLLRPVLRLLSAPLGCLTLGLFGFVIDVGLIYLCARLIGGYAPGLPCAALTAFVINFVSAFAGGRK